MDENLERAIDSAGRERVFALVSANGWAGGPAKFIWWLAVATLRERGAEPEPPGDDA